jgi:RND family efflux transporter MFP subunit
VIFGCVLLTKQIFLVFLHYKLLILGMNWIIKNVGVSFRTIAGVLADFRKFFWPVSHGQKTLRLGLLVIAVIFFGRFIGANDAPVTTEVVAQPPLVSLTSAGQVANSQMGSFLGTVRAVSEAQIQTEVAGRVTAVNVRPGDTIAAGTLVATLENASQRAAVLQAEGAYEQAVANAAISTVSATDAANAVRQAVDNVYNSVSTVRATISDLRSDELNILVADENNIYRTGSVLLRSDAEFIRTVETIYRRLPETLATLQSQLTSARDPQAAQTLIVTTQSVLSDIDVMTDSFRALLDDDDIDTQPDPEDAAFLANLATVEAQINAQRRALSAAEGQLDSALEAQNRAALAASQSDVSLADAQVKSALGSLRAAQAQLAKTILRAPIAGTVNDVSVNVGDFVASFTPVAEIANNGSLEVQFFVTERDAVELTINQPVTVGSLPGTIVSIAPAVNAATQKIEVRAAVEGTNLTNGSTVPVTPLATGALTETEVRPVRLPITAVRFTVEDGFVFLVDTENQLEAQPVTLGSIVGSTVEITSGIDYSTQVVADARGLTAGQMVTVATNE